MPQTVLLTGATGYIAKHIALQLLNAGYDVRGTVRSISRAAEVADAVRPHLNGTTDLDTRLTCVALDLSRDDGWDEAMAGVDILMHTASPFPLVQPKDADDVIRPAVDGALRAVKAAHNAGVKRIVMTSSTAAISGCALSTGQTAYDENNWTDTTDDRVNPYGKSKTLAERAVWDYAKEYPELKVTMINPGFVVGAPLDKTFGTSVEVIARILRAKDPMVPQFGFTCVDVRDVAETHVTVIDKPETHGQRIMIVDRFMWFVDMAKAIKAAYPNRKVVTRVAPNFFVRLLGIFDPAVRSIVPDLGKRQAMDNARAAATLGRPMRPVPEAVVDTATYLIDEDLV
ncbi:NAD-dependent epimerase/dehydratase family protein [Yoonia sp. 2307UL14-13]|uniref:NAD-dependent epimerase/dehydratase family protein n=1 Tax=Yoonia sp. 2307UL14-13 TaxID=3126506 RepID=UPI0030A2291B